MSEQERVIDLSPSEFLSLELIEGRSRSIVLRLQRFRKATNANPAKRVGQPVLLTAEQAQGLSRQIGQLARFLPRSTER